jgi:phosphatidylglycerophosphate synthase
MAGRGRKSASAPRRLVYRDVVAALAGLQKSPRGVSAYSSRVNRPIGRRLAAVAAVLRLSPNHVTVLSAVFSFGSIAVLATSGPSVAAGVAAGVGLVFGFALDSADGQLARVSSSGSASGEWLDHVIDCATKLALHGAVLVAWYRHEEFEGHLAIPLVFQGVAVLLFFGGTLASKLLEAAPARPRATGGSATRVDVRSLLLLPVDYGILCLSFLLWGWPEAFTAVYTVLCVIYAGYLAAFAIKWFRDLDTQAVP